MRIGMVTPVLVQHPATRSEWERTAGIAEVAQVVETADRLGYHHVTCSEHVAVPVAVAEERGGTYWDPLATLGYLAARTTHIRLVTEVLVLGYHHPLELAKRYGTLDQVSGGRVTLGLGVGSLREEFELLGASFDDRGARADDAITALRGALSTRVPTYHGVYFDFEDFVLEPHAAQAKVPLWIGGRTRRSLRRAIEHGDGWVPFGLTLRELTTMLGTVEVPSEMELVLSGGRPLDPLGARESTERAVRRVREAGATMMNIHLVARSAAHYCDQLSAMKDLAVGQGVTFADSASTVH